jgi:hypothetical protein
MRASPFVLVFILGRTREPMVFRVQQSLVVQRENSGGGADTGSSKRIDDIGHNLCPLDAAAIAAVSPAQREVVIVVSRSQATADQALVMMSVILPSLRAGISLPPRIAKRPRPGGWR